MDVTRSQAIETLIAAAIVLAGLALARLLALVLRRVVHRYTRATETALDDQLAAALRAPLLVLVVVQSLGIALRTLSYLDPSRALLDRVWMAVTIVAVVLVVQRALAALLTWYAHAMALRTATDWDRRSLPMVRRVLNVAVIVIGALVAMDQLGVSISPLLAGLGIGGVAVALAVQPLLTNIVAGSYMLSDASIRVGDFIEVSGGLAGWVEDLGFRATRLRTVDNTVVIVPNARLADSIVINFDVAGAAGDAAVTCGVAYEEDLARVERVCLEELRAVIAGLEQAVKDAEPVFRFQRFGESNVEFLAKVRTVNRRDVGLVTHTMMLRLHARLTREGIAIGYPARRLLLARPDSEGLERLAGR